MLGDKAGAFLTQEFSIHEIEQIVVRAPHAHVKVQATTSETMQAEIELIGDCSTTEAWMLSAKNIGGMLMLTNTLRKNKDLFYISRITLNVPTNIYHFELHTDDGDIDLRRINTNVLASTRSGSIYLDDIDRVTASSIDGQITISGTKGDCIVQSQGGKIKLNNIGGSLRVTGIPSVLKVDGCKGNVLLQSSRCHAVLSRLSSRIDANVEIGEIELDYDSNCEGGEIETISANIVINFTDGGVDVRAQTIGGIITTPEGVIKNKNGLRRFIKVIGKSKASLQLRSGNGNIEVNY